MNQLTKEEFDQIGHSEIFATGVLPNSPEGIFMSDEKGKLRWVAVKGGGNDWTIYCHWVDYTKEWIKQHGDKVTTEEYIKRCIPCDDEVFKLYRY